MKLDSPLVSARVQRETLRRRLGCLAPLVVRLPELSAGLSRSHLYIRYLYVRQDKLILSDVFADPAYSEPDCFCLHYLSNQINLRADLFLNAPLTPDTKELPFHFRSISL